MDGKVIVREQDWGGGVNGLIVGTHFILFNDINLKTSFIKLILFLLTTFFFHDISSSNNGNLKNEVIFKGH